MKGRSSRSRPRPRALLLDALGTLLRLDAPVDRLRAELEARTGAAVERPRAAAALRAEIAYYRANHLRGNDARGLESLRRDCARVMADLLPIPLTPDLALACLLAALRFGPYPDAGPALAHARRAGLRLVVVSNWDCSLASVLEDVGLGSSVDAAVASAVVGAAKPDPRPFRSALEAAGCEAADALMVGDSVEADVAGANALGIPAVLVRRGSQAPPAPAGVAAIADLGELASVT